MEDTKTLEQAARGRVAHYVGEQMEPYLSTLESNLIIGLKNIYRDDEKEKSNAVLLAKIAGLCIIDDLRNNLTQDIKLGGQAQRKLDK